MGIMDKIPGIAPRSSGETFMDTIISKLIDNLPPQALDQIKYVAETVRGFDERFRNIQNQNNEILAAIKRMSPAGYNAGIGTGNGADDSAGEQPEA